MIIYDSILVLPTLLVYILTRRWTVTLLVLLFLLVFMYSPDRSNESFQSDIFYSPSAGYVKSIRIQDDSVKITLFLNVFDNHTQYFPLRSEMVSKKEIHGAFVPAYKEHALNNQRVENTLYSKEHNMYYKVTQITGLLTRRILSLASPNIVYHAGQRLGFIVLGSRVDITVPVSFVDKIMIKESMHIKELTPIIKLK